MTNSKRKPAFTRRGVIKILLLIIVATWGFAIYYPFSPAGRQQRNLIAAGEHRLTLDPVIRSDSRFTDVHLGEFTGGGGRLMVYGRVHSTEALSDLQAIVDESNPPVNVEWRVEVWEVPVDE